MHEFGDTARDAHDDARGDEAGRTRGVSDVIGFVLVFSLIILTVAAVYTAGFDGLTNVREAEQSQNAERAFEVLANNIDDLVERGAPSRGTEIKLADARITYGDPVMLNVSVRWTNPDGTTNQTYYQTETVPIVYETGTGTRIVYSNGAVIRQQPGGSVMLEEPSFVFGNPTVLPHVGVRPTGRQSLGGTTRVLVRTVLADRYVTAYTEETYTATMNITTERWRAWRNALGDHAETSCSVVEAPGDDKTVSCTFSADRIYVQVVEVDARFI